MPRLPGRSPRRGRWEDLTPRQRAVESARAAAHLVLVWVAVLAIYFLLPLDQDDWSDALVRLGLALVLLVGLVVWQVSRVLDSDVPTLRAAEALGSILVVFLAVFASSYLGLSHADPSRFNVPLDHVGALYFTTTVLATVGFGDITPAGDLMQGLVTAQMVLDLVLLGVVVRVVLRAAQRNREAGGSRRRSDEPEREHHRRDVDDARGPGV